MHNNSVIFKNLEDEHLIDLSYLGTILKEDTNIQITQKDHFFIPGDVLAYDPQSRQFIKALAVNTIQSEVCGVVSKVIDHDNFVLITQGAVEASQYKYPDGSILWLSENVPGKLMSVNPVKTFKRVGVQISEGKISVRIKMGLTINSGKSDESGPYTKEELDEIIANVM